MKKLIIILLLFIANTDISFSKETNNFDYKNYLLTGIFKKQLLNPEVPDYFYIWNFYIYDNKVYLTFEGENAGSLMPQPMPDGTFELSTNKNSKIKIKIKDGKVIDFELLSDIKEFLEKEEDINKNYCEKGYFYSFYNDLYFTYKTKSYFIKDTRNAIEIIDVDNKLLVSFLDFSGKFPANEREVRFKLIEDKDANSNNYTKTRNNKYILKNIDNKNEADLIIKNCAIIYFNKK